VGNVAEGAQQVTVGAHLPTLRQKWEMSVSGCGFLHQTWNHQKTVQKRSKNAKNNLLKAERMLKYNVKRRVYEDGVTTSP